jgi:hypothetical protein
MAKASSRPQPLATARRSRPGRNKWVPPTPTELLADLAASSPTTVLPWLQHPTLAALRERLQLVFDCWNLLSTVDGSSRRSVYLPPGAEEPDGSYRNRIENARPSGFFRDALRTYAGMLSSCHWLTLPPSLQACISDVDGRGTDLGVFLFILDLLVLRDGGVLIQVLPPVHRWPSEGDRQQALRRGDRLSLPRLALVPRGDFLNWTLPNPDGLPVRLFWREPDPLNLRQCDLGSPQVHYLNLQAPQTQALDQWIYRAAALTDDGLRLTTFRARPDLRHPDGFLPEYTAEPLLYPNSHELPVVWYAADGAAFGEGDLPHLGLANQYLTHYRLKSEYEDLLSRTSLPVGVRSGLVDQYGMRPTPDGDHHAPERLVLSTNTFMDLPDGADFNWKEIRARSLAEHRAYLVQLEDTMRRDALVPSTNRGAGRSEQEVSLTAGQSYALLQSLATQKVSAFSSLLRHWCAMTGEALTAGSGLSLTVTPLTPPLRPQPTVSEWLTLHERGIITDEEIRHQLTLSSRAGVVTPVDGPTDSFAPTPR